MIVVGGVIPPDDVPTLLEMGAAAVFPPGTVIADAALGLLEKLSTASWGTSRLTPPQVDVDALVEGVRAGRRAAVARAITLVESTRARPPGRGPRAGRRADPATPSGRSACGSASPACPGSASRPSSRRSAPPDRPGHRVGVLAVDPSSVRTGGSVLGDKTRMARLPPTRAPTSGRRRPRARWAASPGRPRRRWWCWRRRATTWCWSRPSASGSPRSRWPAWSTPSCFLTLARTGDQLQGIKKGILEIADVIAVNKADGPRGRDARRPPGSSPARCASSTAAAAANWVPPVLTCSGLHGTGVARGVGAGAGAPRVARGATAWPPSGPSSSWTSPGRWSATSSSTAAALARRAAGARRACAARCWPASCRPARPPTGCSPRTTTERGGLTALPRGPTPPTNLRPSCT